MQKKYRDEKRNLKIAAQSKNKTSPFPCPQVKSKFNEKSKKCFKEPLYGQVIHQNRGFGG